MLTAVEEVKAAVELLANVLEVLAVVEEGRDGAGRCGGGCGGEDVQTDKTKQE